MSTNNQDIDQLLNQWLNGDITDQSLIDQIGIDDFRKYKQILGEVDQWKPSLDATVFEPQIITSKPKSGKLVSIRRFVPYSVAASIVLILAVGAMWLLNSEVSYSTEIGQTMEVELPDGSIAVLGPNSELSWSSDDWTIEQRSLSLQGKGHFEVKKGSPFSVNTDNGSVEVLGTSFDIVMYDIAMQVTCYEGKVRAKGLNKESIILTKGESSHFKNGKWEGKILIEHSEPYWIMAEPTFKNAPLELVILELENLYGAKISVGNINMERRFTGSIPKDDLKQALKIVFTTLGIQYEVKGNQVFLSE
ncbi:MAG: FecR domain-containing protein [Reichenbachiella sp.]